MKIFMLNVLKFLDDVFWHKDALKVLINNLSFIVRLISKGLKNWSINISFSNLRSPFILNQSVFP